jgi:hypothetical protein
MEVLLHDSPNHALPMPEKRVSYSVPPVRSVLLSKGERTEYPYFI